MDSHGRWPNFLPKKNRREAEEEFEEEIIYSDGNDIRDRIYRKMCEMNVTLLEMYVKKPTLEQVFMELTQEE